jgi:TolA-binding protein
LSVGTPVVWGQADARAAFEAGKTAYQAGDFAKAKEQFLAASQTDAKNAEAFLWLGKAQYQLGAIEEAINAWTNTLKLAPEEPYAQRMLAALRGELGQVENRLALVDVLLAERLYPQALLVAGKMTEEKGLTDGQRVRGMIQKAEALLGTGAADGVPAIVHEIVVKYPKLAEPGRAGLLLGQAYLRVKPDHVEQGLAMLKKVMAEQAGTAAAKAAEYELLVHELGKGITVERVEALVKWLEREGPQTRPAGVVAGFDLLALRVRDGRLRLVEAQRALAGQDKVLTAALNARILAVLDPVGPGWSEVAWKQVDLLDAEAEKEMRENLRMGRGEENAKIGDKQQQLIGVLGRIVLANADDAARAIERLSKHLEPWIVVGQYPVAEEALVQLGKALPAKEQTRVRLAVIGLWVRQVASEHERLLAANLAPPRQLDPRMAKAALELYALHRGMSEQDPLLGSVRGQWDAIVDHYKRLDYFDVAQAAILAKAAPAAALADAHAQIQFARLLEEQARRELAQVLQQHDGAKKLTLTPAWRAAVEAYQKLINDYPTSLEVDRAVDGVFNIARTFEQHQAYDVAADVYRGFVFFGAKQKVLIQATPATPSPVERADFAVAAALDAKAVAALNKLTAERKPDTPPLAKISDEFVAAVAAYKDFLRNRPNSPLMGAAIGKVMAIAQEYAQVDAWDVADGVLGDLAASGLALWHPERIEFARAVCVLGKGVPDHAREVLKALIQGTIRTSGEGMDFGAVAAGGRVTTRPLDRFVGRGMGGMGMGGYGGGYGGDGGLPAAKPSLPTELSAQASDELRQADLSALAAITQHESRRAAQVAAIRDKDLFANAVNAPAMQQGMQQRAEKVAVMPVLSDAEIARLEGVFDAAYKAFKAIGEKYPTTITARQARGEMLVMVTHWRSLQQWQRAAALAQRMLADHPTDLQLPQIRLQIARDYLSWAAVPTPRVESKQAMLAEVVGRFEKAREELNKIVTEFTDQRDLKQLAQWDIATSYLNQARVVDTFSPTLARGQYVRAARELQRVARTFVDHPSIGTVPNLLWQIGSELAARSYWEEAIIVWTDLINFDPTHDLARQAAPQIAATYQTGLGRPLRAVESYVEINFARGGDDPASQNAIFQIGSQLKEQKRWVEALSVLETFVDSFPRNANAGQALTMVGQIHQANEAWPDAITAYKRVINEYPAGNWVQEAKWAIAECTINLSQWREAMSAYETYVAAFPQDPKVAEANRRIGVLKDLARYQVLVDEQGQRKSFDAQFQIASIIQTQLANPQKAIIEYRKVVTNWPQSHLADDALYAIGVLYLERGETDKARQSLQAMASQYPDSNLTDDALLMVGKSFEDESARLAGLTRGATQQLALEQAQKDAYRNVQQLRSEARSVSSSRIMELKKGGQGAKAEIEEANVAAGNLAWSGANFEMAVNKARQDVETLTAVQLADRQDKINAALRKAVEAYGNASKVPGADKAGDALLRMAVIYDEQLKDSQAALATWQEIVRQFSGTAVAEEASWRIAQYHDRAGQWAEAVEAYKAFLRNYRRSPKAGQAQFNVAEGYEHLNKWVEAMDAYTNYITTFAEGPLVPKAKEQINWIKTYRL